MYTMYRPLTVKHFIIKCIKPAEFREQNGIKMVCNA